MAVDVDLYAPPVTAPVSGVVAGDLVLLNPWERVAARQDWGLVEAALDASHGPPVITVLDSHHTRCSLLAVGALPIRRPLNRR